MQIKASASRMLEVVFASLVVAVEALEAAESRGVFGFEKAQVPFPHGCVRYDYLITMVHSARDVIGPNKEKRKMEYQCIDYHSINHVEEGKSAPHI